MGAGLPAIAVYQPAIYCLTLRYRGQARSHRGLCVDYRGCAHSSAWSTTPFAISTKCITARCGAFITSPDAFAVSTAQCNKSAAWARASSKLRLSLSTKLGASGADALR